MDMHFIAILDVRISTMTSISYIPYTEQAQVVDSDDSEIVSFDE